MLVLRHHVISAGQLLELFCALEYAGVNITDQISEFAIELST